MFVAFQAGYQLTSTFYERIWKPNLQIAAWSQ